MLSNYMERSRYAIEKYVNLVAADYSMCIILPFINNKDTMVYPLN